MYSTETIDKIIYTTGAYLKPMQIKDANGNDIWVWTVERFEESSFYDGQEYNPVEIADNLEELLIDTTPMFLH